MPESDYITRSEFEEFRAMMLVQGDQQTIEVDHTPGGQVVRSIQALPEPPEDGATGYISITYDDSPEEFTVTITDIPYINITAESSNYIKLNNYDNADFISETFIFDKPASSFYTLNLTIGKDREVSANLGTAIYWYSTQLSTADSNTSKLYSPTAASRPFAEIRLYSDGTYTIESEINSGTPVISGNMPANLYGYVSTGGRKIYLENYINPNNPSSSTLNDNPLTYSEPINTSLILGWDYGNTAATLDLDSNGNSYDETLIIGSIEIDSNNDVRRFTVFSKGLRCPHPPFGYTGNHTIDGFGVFIQNGIIINLIPPPP